MTKILIIYTGGTIGMVESEDRQSLVPFDLKHILEQVPEIKKLQVQLDPISFDVPIDSSDMQPAHWIQMAEMIEAHYHSHDGFVILHGSDTLAYSASALSFMLEGLRKPVILTGSQLPIGMIRTDARENLITAIELAALRHDDEPAIQEVAIYFEYKLYRGNRTTKVSAEAFEAFASPNYPLLAEAGVHIEVDYARLFRPAPEFLVHKRMDASVGLLTVVPGMSEALVKATLELPDQRAIVFRTYGSGNAPQTPWLVQALKQAIDRGLIVVNLSQCMKGAVEQGKYATSRGLVEAGLISGGDMTLDACITKLMYLLSHSQDNAWIKEQIAENLRGELSVS